MNEKFKFYDGADLFKQRLSKLTGSFVGNKGILPVNLDHQTEEW